MPSDSLSNSPERDAGAAERSDAFRVSTAPLIPERNGTRGPNETDDLVLPRSYGLETLWLMARDPHSLFACWDIDWRAAFGEENPRRRKVRLRVLAEDNSEHANVEVEPMAGQCSVRVEKADATYRGEIGYLDPAGAWHVVSRSESVSVPPEAEGNSEPADFATVPLHLSFQHLLDSTRAAEEENNSLTGMLSRLRLRAAGAQTSEALTAQQRDVVRALEEATTRDRAKGRSGSASPDLWVRHRLEKIFGFGNSSLSGGFGGGSRAYPPR